MHSIGTLNLGQLVDPDFFDNKVVYQNGESTHEISRHPSDDNPWVMQLQTSVRTGNGFARTEQKVRLNACSASVQETLTKKFRTARMIDYKGLAEQWKSMNGITDDMLDAKTYMDLQSPDPTIRSNARKSARIKKARHEASA